jgi:hypothetical protein
MRVTACRQCANPCGLLAGPRSRAAGGTSGGLAEGKERRAVGHGQEGVHAASEGDQVIDVPLERGHEALLGLGKQDMDHARGASVSNCSGTSASRAVAISWRRVKYSPRHWATHSHSETCRAAASSFKRR